MSEEQLNWGLGFVLNIHIPALSFCVWILEWIQICTPFPLCLVTQRSGQVITDISVISYIFLGTKTEEMKRNREFFLLFSFTSLGTKPSVTLSFELFVSVVLVYFFNEDLVNWCTFLISNYLVFPIQVWAISRRREAIGGNFCYASSVIE